MRKTLILAILVVLPLTFHGCDKNDTTVELPPPVKTDDKDKGGDSGNTGGETNPWDARRPASVPPAMQSTSSATARILSAQ